MRKILFFVLVCLSLSSCVISPKKRIRVEIYEENPWEEVTGEYMYYDGRYFDGDKVKNIYLSENERSFYIEANPSSLILVSLVPLGLYSPIVGFLEGEGDIIYLYSDDEKFISMLLDVAEVYPEAVRDLSLKKLKESFLDLNAIDRESFISLLYSGKVEKDNVKLSLLYTIPLDGVPSGLYLSITNKAFSIEKDSSLDSIKLFPGVWYYYNDERKRVLEIVVDEKGGGRIRIKEIQKWY